MATTVNVLLGLFSIWLCVSYSCAENATATEEASQASEASQATTEGIPVSTTPPAFSIKLQHVESSTSSIKFNWSVPNIYEIKYSQVRSNRFDSEAITTSPDLTETEYVVEDLRRDTKYNICVTVFNDGTEHHGAQECGPFETIPLIRDDSLIALFCVLGFLLLCILGAYLCWRYQQAKHAEEEEEEEGETAKLNNTHGNPVSIEDRDIPFITPPPDELSPEERRQYDAAAKA